jgi:hypothetical protein
LKFRSVSGFAGVSRVLSLREERISNNADLVFSWKLSCSYKMMAKTGMQNRRTRRNDDASLKESIGRGDRGTD